MKNKYFVDLFAGCGGLSLGLEKAGFSPVLVSELNKDAMETYLHNRDDEFPLLRKKYNVNDIKELTGNPNKLETIIRDMKVDYDLDIAKGELDLLVGGPPCQGFSGIGHRRSYSVDKAELPSNHLYLEMISLINKFKPKIFLFENVKGILSGRWTSGGEKGEIWKDISTAFMNIEGYKVEWSLVHAKDYGVAQNRPRVLLVGIRDDIVNSVHIPLTSFANGFLPTPTNDYPTLSELLGDLVDDDFQYGGTNTTYVCDPQNDVQKQFRTQKCGNILVAGNSLTEQEYSNHSLKIIEKFNYMLANDGDIPDHLKTKKFSQKALKPSWDEKGPNITATSAPDDYVHFAQARSLTVREWARLQTFPDYYTFSGKRTTGGLRRAGNPQEGLYDRELPKYTQIGNAVPVKLAEKVGNHLNHILEDAL